MDSPASPPPPPRAAPPRGRGARGRGGRGRGTKGKKALGVQPYATKRYGQKKPFLSSFIVRRGWGTGEMEGGGEGKRRGGPLLFPSLPPPRARSSRSARGILKPLMIGAWSARAKPTVNSPVRTQWPGEKEAERGGRGPLSPIPPEARAVILPGGSGLPPLDERCYS